MSTLTVGSGQEYSTIAAAVAASKDGDVIQIQAGTYTNDFAEITKQITLEGVGGLAKLVATGAIPGDKGILVTDTNVTIDHLSFSGATGASGNDAGIRYQGGALTITNSVFTNNQNGILAAADPNGTISISHSEFASNGSGSGNTHNIYIGNIAALTIDSSYFHDANVGHEIKSRAAVTTITNSRIEDGPNGTASYSIDLPNGGQATISNDTIEQGPNSQNPLIIAYGEEGNLYAKSSLTVSNNTFLNDLKGSPSIVAVTNSTGTVATVSNDSTYGLTSSQVLHGPGTVTNTTMLSSEPALDTSSPVQAKASSGSTSTGSAGSVATTSPSGSTGMTSTGAGSGTGAGTGTGTMPTGTTPITGANTGIGTSASTSTGTGTGTGTVPITMTSTSTPPASGKTATGTTSPVTHPGGSTPPVPPSHGPLGGYDPYTAYFRALSAAVASAEARHPGQSPAAALNSALTTVPPTSSAGILPDHQSTPTPFTSFFLGR